MGKQRVVSVDIFRGATIVLMILVNTPGTWEYVYGPLLHAEWHGYTPTDLVFPFFLYIVGTSIVLAYRDREPDAATVRKISIRTLKLIGLGLFLGAFTISFPFIKPFEEIRFPGVLQRIGIVFFITALLYIYTNRKILVAVCISLLIGYWLWMGFVPLEGAAPTFDRAPNNWANYIDYHILGSHMYKADYDPEGILSTIGAVATCLFGVFAGWTITSNGGKKVEKLVLAGVALLLLGYAWNIAFPINKALWTSSYVLVTAGWAGIILGVVYYLSDAKKLYRGTIFRYAGANAIILYFLSSFITKLWYEIEVAEGISLHQWLFTKLFRYEGVSAEFSSMVYGLSVVGFYLLLAYILYRKKIFIKV